MDRYKIKNIQKARPGAKILQWRPKKSLGELFGAKANAKAEEGETNIFYDSLAVMSQKDIELNETAQNYKKPSTDFLRYFVLLLALGMLAFSGYKFVEQLFSYVKAAQDYDAIRSVYYDDEEGDLEAVQFLRKTRTNFPIRDIFSLQKQTGERVVQSEVGEGVGEIDKIRRSFKKLSDINSDMFGWIKVQHTTIDYPVVQCADNDFYLSRNFYKVYSSGGAIFADYRNNRNVLNDRHLVIYGHNMLDNNMFQPLITAYEKIEDNFKTGIIELITDGGIYYYEIFSVGEEDPSSGYIQTYFESDEEYVKFLKTIKARSNFQKNVVLDANSKIITLSTCVNAFWIDQRFVVRGVLIDVK
jgi:sortase B